MILRTEIDQLRRVPDTCYLRKKLTPKSHGLKDSVRIWAEVRDTGPTFGHKDHRSFYEDLDRVHGRRPDTEYESSRLCRARLLRSL